MLNAADRDVLAHVLVEEDPDDYYARAVARYGQDVAEQHIANKVNRWRGEFLAAKTRDGANYKTGIERQTETKREILGKLGATDEQIEKAMRPAVRLKDLKASP